MEYRFGSPNSSSVEVKVFWADLAIHANIESSESRHLLHGLMGVEKSLPSDLQPTQRIYAEA
jgi:hypothetical protein